MIIHNVTDVRWNWIGSYNVVPFNVDDIGKTISIIYQSNDGRAEKGLFSSYRNGIVFALFSKGDTAAGCDESNCFRVIDKLGEPNV